MSSLARYTTVRETVLRPCITLWSWSFLSSKTPHIERHHQQTRRAGNVFFIICSARFINNGVWRIVTWPVSLPPFQLNARSMGLAASRTTSIAWGPPVAPASEEPGVFCYKRQNLVSPTATVWWWQSDQTCMLYDVSMCLRTQHVRWRSTRLAWCGHWSVVTGVVLCLLIGSCAENYFANILVAFLTYTSLELPFNKLEVM
jgi:hypothetical protein